MNDLTFLQRIFDGYVTTYRQNLWHSSANYSDMTAGELGFFATLGMHLGYTVRREMNWDFPRDLCWCEVTDWRRDKLLDNTPPDNRPIDVKAGTILYLERENHDDRVDITVKKLLDKRNTPTRIPYLIAVFGWTRPRTLLNAKQLARDTLPETSHTRLMLISWIGETQDGKFNKIEGWILERDENGHLSEYVREASPELDMAGYWYMHFAANKPWHAARTDEANSATAS